MVVQRYRFHGDRDPATTRRRLGPRSNRQGRQWVVTASCRRKRGKHDQKPVACRPMQSLIGPGCIGLELGPVAFTWSMRDAILYSLGIGARLPEDLEFIYEGIDGAGPTVEPTFVLTAITPMLPLLVRELRIDLRCLLHASQAIVVHRPVRPAGTCRVARRITGVWDKGRAAIIDCEDRVIDGAGLVAVARSSWWVDGAGGLAARGRIPMGRSKPLYRAESQICDAAKQPRGSRQRCIVSAATSTQCTSIRRSRANQRRSGACSTVCVRSDYSATRSAESQGHGGAYACSRAGSSALSLPDRT